MYTVPESANESWRITKPVRDTSLNYNYVKSWILMNGYSHAYNGMNKSFNHV